MQMLFSELFGVVLDMYVLKESILPTMYAV